MSYSAGTIVTYSKWDSIGQANKERHGTVLRAFSNSTYHIQWEDGSKEVVAKGSIRKATHNE